MENSVKVHYTVTISVEMRGFGRSIENMSDSN